MKTTIDRAGRLVIPKDIRREAGIKPGMPLEILGEKALSPLLLLLCQSSSNDTSPLTSEGLRRKL